MIGGNVWNTDIGYEERYTGRLRRLADMPFFEGLQEHVEGRGAGLRFVRPGELKAALERRAGADGTLYQRVREPAGDSVELAPTTPVQIYEVLADKARIHIFPTERLASKDDLSGALLQAGLIPAGYEPERGLADSWIFVANIPGGVAAARARLTAAKLFSAKCTPVKRLHEGTFEQLALGAGGELLMVRGNPVLWRDITWTTVDVPRALPADAMILVALEHPESYWYVLPLIIFLALASLFFLYALIRALR
jgi:hypothetical protein